MPDETVSEDRLTRLVLPGYCGKVLTLRSTGGYARSILSISDADGTELASMVIDENLEFELWEHIGNTFAFEAVDLDQYKR